MLHYQVVRTSPGGATLSNKMNNTVHCGHVRHTLALMCAKNHLLTFSSFVDIWENVEWPRFFGPPCITVCHSLHDNSLSLNTFKRKLKKHVIRQSIHLSIYLFQAAWPISETQETQNIKTHNMKKTEKSTLKLINISDETHPASLKPYMGTYVLFYKCLDVLFY